MAIGWQVICTALSGQSKCTMARRRSTLALRCLLQPTLLLLQLDSPVRRIVIFSRFLSAMDHPEILTAGSLPACLPWLTAWGDSVVDSPLPPLLWPTVPFSASYTNSQVPAVTYEERRDSAGPPRILTDGRENFRLRAPIPLDCAPWHAKMARRHLILEAWALLPVPPVPQHWLPAPRENVGSGWP